MDSTQDLDYQRRFGGVARLYGEAGLARFEAAHVCVIGIGGVGSWAAEAIARSAVGRITLIDLDHVAPSNVNRQLHALDATLGQAKVSAMAERIAAINPRAQVTEVDDFLTDDNLAELIPPGRFDYVLDCIDQMRVKVALVRHCRRHKIPLLVSGGAGGRLDASRVAIADLALTSGDALLSKIRAELRRNHGFPREGKKFGIEAVYSTEPIIRPKQDACEPVSPGGAGLNCAGYGSAVAVTASFGMALAGRALAQLSNRKG
ncbi:tRNA threonylcarbamoyladenosine dehydratase [Chitinimonas sp.]|uniref:tRNA threonylcarbamoyladenosine dehydratase n=1 Tax=Chitinimonas sp. TaxID=1934313 RepID=UPI002F9249A6